MPVRTRPTRWVAALSLALALLAPSLSSAQWQADRGLVLVGTAVTMNDAGPRWMYDDDGWARRVGTELLMKRRNITLTVPEGIIT